jgi:hypothetical protein
MQYIVFHTSTAGRPDSYDGIGWTFEPKRYDGSQQFAPVYTSVEEATAAADKWLASEEWEEEVHYFFS